MKRFFHAAFIFFFLFPISLIANVDELIDDIDSVIVFPQNNSVLEGFSKGDSIVFKTCFDSICGGFYERLVNDNGDYIYETFNSVKTDSGAWLLKFYDDVVLQKGHTYTLEIVGHEAADLKSPITGKVKINYVGNGQEQQDDDYDDYEYSNIKYVSFSPENLTEYSNLRLNFVICDFTGDVNIDMDRSIIIDENNNEWHFLNDISINGSKRSWQLFIPLEVLQNSTSGFKIHIYAKDLGGRAVKGNMGKGINSYYELYYKCEIGYPKLTIMPVEGRVSNLSKFYFSHNNGIVVKGDENHDFSQDYQMLLLGQDKTTVIDSFKPNELVLSETNSNVFYYQMEDTLKTEGIYYLYIPKGVFSISEKMLDNKEVWIKYELVDRMGLYGIIVDPEDGSEVTRLSKINITFNQDATPYYLNPQRITVTNEVGDTVAYAHAMKDENRTNPGQCYIQLDEPVKEAGQYRVNIPEGSFYLGFGYTNASLEMYLDYTIPGVPDPILNPDVIAQSDAEGALERIIIHFNNLYHVGLVENDTFEEYPISLKDSLDNEVASCLIRLGRSNIEYLVDSFSEKITIPNNYFLHIQPNILTFNRVPYTEELILKVPFDPTTGIEYAISSFPEQSVRVYNLQGMLVRMGKTDMVFKNLRKGQYFVNGKKILIK